MQVTWESPLATVLGPGTAKVKGKKSGDVVKDSGLETVGDLIGHLPRSYVAKGTLSNLDELVEGDLLTIVGEVAGAQLKTYRDRRTGREAARIEMRVRAENGALDLTFFDRAKHISEWRIKEFSRGTLGIFRGKLKWWQGHWQLTNPEYRLFAEGGGVASIEAMPELVPLYPEVGKVSSWVLEEAIGLALDLVTEVPDVLPEALRAEHDLLDAGTAYRWIHRPDSHGQLGAARKRLKFDEAFVTQAVLARRRLLTERSDATPRPGRPDGMLSAFDQALPFDLTAGQATVGEEIGHELADSHPMHRLLQGEVGSGKTLVALRAMLQVVDSGGQAALLAPTEVLAQQHLRSITTMLGDLAQGGELGAPEHATRVTLLTGSMNAAQRRQALADAAGGDAGIVIGTHALLQEHVQFQDLGLVVIDEQHRFGVEQRAALSVKSAKPPHVLVMTATPIPRTVAMTVFGDLDTSTLTELPAGRGEVQTNVVPTLARPAWLDRAWERIREEVGKGRQAYLVCPRIGDEPPPEEGPELHSVEELAPELATGPLQGLRVQRLHGRMGPEDKDRVMQSFAAGEVDVLVSTTVIEVGVDVPNATVMVILDADRFGVSQLHQLRGRIGRGGHSGLCLLVSNAEPDSPSMERLSAVASTRDGFALSRIDLEQRREGNVLGVEQSGRRRTLKLLSVLTDEDVIATAREAAMRLLREDPALDTAPGLARAVKELEDSSAADYLEMT